MKSSDLNFSFRKTALKFLLLSEKYRLLRWIVQGLVFVLSPSNKRSIVSFFDASMKPRMKES